jgi:protein-S-isoprenylcysteine O-methyltransferase Ste14
MFMLKMVKITTDKEGRINNYRKPVLTSAAVGFMALWFFTAPGFPVSEQFADFLRHMGGVLVALGVVGRMYSSLTIAANKNEKLVMTEMYSVVRNPLYFFSFFIVIGAGLLTTRLDLTLYLAAVYMICFYPMILNEERYLKQKFKANYTNYMKNTPRIIPDFSKWKAREKMEINMRLVTRTTRDAGLALLIIPVVATIQYLQWLLK